MSHERTSQIDVRSKIPSDYTDDVERAIRLLTDVGCTEVYLFGSIVNGGEHRNSDIDIAVRGCPSERFYYAVGKLLIELDHSVDLIDLDRRDRFTATLENTGALVRVA